MKRLKTLYVSDMDGTLLSSDSRVSETSARIISELSRQGAMITVATARTPATVKDLLSSTYTTVPAIVMTGAAYWDRVNEAFISPAIIDSDDVDVVMDLCTAHGIYPFIYALDNDFRHLEVFNDVHQLNKAEQSFYEQRRSLLLKRFHMSTPLPEAYRHKVMLFYATAPIGAVEKLAAGLAKVTKCCISCYPDIFNNSTGQLEILAPGVNKAAAVLRLKELVKAERLVVFGDNLNDLSMLRVADVAVAVGNAFEQVKEAADVVIGPNYADSVARFIEADFMGE